MGAFAQTAVDSTGVDPEKLPKEKVEGFWPVMGYLGGKLTKELGKRLNLESEEKKKGELTEVDVELGWIKFTRVEER